MKGEEKILSRCSRRRSSDATTAAVGMKHFHLLAVRPGRKTEGFPHGCSSDGLKNFSVNSTGIEEFEIVVRAEEALIVGLVLALWVAAIALFFNRWGKIRMLEPYQPKFTQQHRASCPLVDQSAIQHRSFSKFNVAGETLFGHARTVRPRQNSVFVGSSLVTLPPNLPRKVKSAFDLQHLVVSEPSLHKGTASTAVKITLDRPPFRRQSLLTVSPKKPAFEFGSGDAKERRLSFKDFVDLEKTFRCDRVHCRGEKEVQKNEISARLLKSNFSNQRGDGRRNSIAFLDLKPFVGSSGRFPAPERRHSLLSGQKGPSSNAQGTEGGNFRPETKIGVPDFRRNSTFLSCSLENDRSFLSPRETVKSGVVDFRRNSMLIINNLNEDMGCRLFTRNFSLGGSNMGLASDLWGASRRDSGNAFVCHEVKPKASLVKSRQVLTPKYNVFPSAEAKCGNRNRKPSNSLDSEDCADQRNKKEIERWPPPFADETRPTFAGSSASLNACPEPRSRGRVDGTWSSEDVNSDSLPAREDDETSKDSQPIACKSDRSFRGGLDMNDSGQAERRSVPTVNVFHSSLNNLISGSGDEVTKDGKLPGNGI